jgi:hypothetical protein
MQNSRAFGNAPGGPREVFKSKSTNTHYKIPNQDDFHYNDPVTATFSMKLFGWLHGRWNVNLDDRLDNSSKVNKYSAYHWISSSSVYSILLNSIRLNSRWFFKLAQIFLDSSNSHTVNLYGSPMKVDCDTSLNLYQSTNSSVAGYLDILMTIGFTATALGAGPVVYYPFVGLLACYVCRLFKQFSHIIFNT